MAIKRISIFMPRSTPWYEGLVKQMIRGFEALGLQASGHCGLLDETQMGDWCQQHRPQVIMEMNRPRADIPFLSAEIIHICWVVDFNGRHIQKFCESEITYLFGIRWVSDYPHNSFHRWLGPGACPIEYPYGQRPFNCDASFIGHMPNPWSSQELQRNLTGGKKDIYFGEILPELERRFRREKHRLKTHVDYIDVAREICLAACGADLVLDHPLEYDISGRLIRTINRQNLADKLVEVSDSLRFYGPDNWARWPQYKAFYRGFLETSGKMCEVYQSSRINFHEGNGMHFRTLDCMSCGGLLFFVRTSDDDKPGGIQSFFEPYRHYVPFDLDELPEIYREYITHPERCAEIRKSAAQEIQNNHTWKHRAQSIMDDLKML